MLRATQNRIMTDRLVFTSTAVNIKQCLFSLRSSGVYIYMTSENGF